MMWFGGMFLGWVLWLAVIVGGIWFVVHLVASKRRTSDHSTDSSIAILRERFARGEISREEYEQRRKTLLSA
jgi:putative membrane protein